MRRLNVSSAPHQQQQQQQQQQPTMDKLRSTNKPSLFSRSSPKSNHTIILVISSVISLSVFCYLAFLIRGTRNDSISDTKKYAIVIDGGSTGSRIHVFEYGVNGGEKRLDFDFGENGLASMRVTPGLSSYAEEDGDRDAAGASLMELLEFGKVRVPKEHWGRTEIRLMATAGLRMLDFKVQEEILESCRKVLRSSGFQFRDDWASVITGSDEGIYAWVVANYALGTLGGDPLQTTGIIELGGASAQVTFFTNEPIPPQFSHTIKFGNYTYHLYSHSMLHFGQNVAMDSLRKSLVGRVLKWGTDSAQRVPVTDPCTPKGYAHDMDSFSPSSFAKIKNYPLNLYGSGNFSECRSASLTLLQEGKEKCSYKHCYIGSAFIPKFQGRFLATENFFHTSKFFGLDSKASLSDLKVAGEQFCQEDWSKLKNKHNSLDKEDLLRYCFSSAYIVAMLHDSLGVSLNDQRIGFANHVGDTPLDWALGAFIMQSTAELEVKHPDWIATAISDDSPTLLSLTVISILLLFTAWSLSSKWRKPQLKTIYDLEKGRYIVTRVR